MMAMVDHVLLVVVVGKLQEHWPQIVGQHIHQSSEW